MTINLTIVGPPRTKKNSSRLVFPGKSYEVWLQYIVHWVRSDCTGEAPKIPYSALMPSDAYREWFEHAMTQAPILCTMARDQGVILPIREPVNVRALFFRKRADGDACGYYQGLGDFLQAQKLDKKTYRVRRRGAGIIDDDRLIQSWDGSRLLKDEHKPRIELEITILSGGQQVNLELPPEQVATTATALEMFR